MTASPQSVVTHPEAVSEKTAAKIASVAAGVSLRSVTKKYGAFTAIENITLDIPSGAYCCLLGPSGCGKTTALRMISGHEEVSAGEVLIGDRPGHKPATRQAKYRNDVSKLCAVSPQNYLEKRRIRP